jgi:hypothetical protein
MPGADRKVVPNAESAQHSDPAARMKANIYARHDPSLPAEIAQHGADAWPRGLMATLPHQLVWTRNPCISLGSPIGTEGPACSLKTARLCPHHAAAVKRARKMRNDIWHPFARNIKAVIITFGLVGIMTGCAPLQGYPKDPEDTDATLVSLQPYFNGTADREYSAITDATQRKQKRDDIIRGRVWAYDIEFADFEQQLYGEGNAVSLGSDLVGLILGGLTATVGGKATKAALGAAATGVIGANNAINKDLYYQKTIPALLAQMDADRLQALAPITAGMKQSDADYPLIQAYIDLDAYKTAGSIPAAINAVNKNAGNAKDQAQKEITIQRGSGKTQLAALIPVQTKLQNLTDAQFLALAKAMQPNLASRSAEIQNLVKSIDRKGARLRDNASMARQVIKAWLGNDQFESNSAYQQQWLDAISSVSKGS